MTHHPDAYAPPAVAPYHATAAPIGGVADARSVGQAAFWSRVLSVTHVLLGLLSLPTLFVGVFFFWSGVAFSKAGADLKAASETGGRDPHRTVAGIRQLGQVMRVRTIALAVMTAMMIAGAGASAYLVQLEAEADRDDREEQADRMQKEAERDAKKKEKKPKKKSSKEPCAPGDPLCD